MARVILGGGPRRRGVRPAVVGGAWGSPIPPTPGALAWASPVKEGAQEAPQQDPVLRACVDMAVHELHPRDIHVGSWKWGGQRMAREPKPPHPPHGQALAWAGPRPSLTTQPKVATSALRKGQRLWCHQPWGTHDGLLLKHQSRQQRLAPWLPGSKGQILNHCVSSPSNHAMETLIYPHVANSAANTYTSFRGGHLEVSLCFVSMLRGCQLPQDTASGQQG